MPLWLLNPKIWLGIGAALIIGLGVWHYRHLSSEAAKVPALTKQVAALNAQHNRDEARASKAAIELVKAYAQRDQAVADFEKWRDGLQVTMDKLGELNNVSPSAKLLACRPTPAERKLWNDTLGTLFQPES